MLILTPLEFLDRLAVLLPPVTAYAGLPLDLPNPPAVPPSPTTASEPKRASPAAYLWAVLLARIYSVLPLICPVCGSEMRLIAAVTEREPVQRILRHIGEPAFPPPISPARFPTGGGVLRLGSDLR